MGGICALFFGAPGTGKTEGAKQLARDSKRDLYKIEMENIRESHVGESAKKIKKIFDEYYALRDEKSKAGKLCPILFLNEADGILSRRRIVDDHNACIEDEENTMRNIFLDEMENFRGIMIVTTNFEKNLDEALDRRFIFKVEFQSPNAEIRAKILKEKICDLSDEELQRIAGMYELSGGEIDNIARKCLIQNVLSGNKTTFEEVNEFCKNEKLERWNKNVVGFAV